MSFSLNELEATAKRAARGAGYSWGLSEEAGKAARWLCAHGVDGAAALARLLELGLAQTSANHAPQSLDGVWTGGGVLCPLATGALLSDCAHLLMADPVNLRRVAVPVLLLPFAANVSHRLQNGMIIDCDGMSAAIGESRLVISGTVPDRADHLEISTGASPDSGHPCSTRAVPDPASWGTLNRLAHRTYAPATEESRLLGAGSGLSDND